MKSLREQHEDAVRMALQMAQSSEFNRNALNRAAVDTRIKYGDTYLDKSRSLTGVPADYVNAGDEPRYECELLPYVMTTSKPMTDNGIGIDIDQFRKDCEKIGYD